MHELIALGGSPPGAVLRAPCLPPCLHAGQVVGTVLVGHTQRLTLECVQLMGGWWAVAQRACLPVDYLAEAMEKGLYVTDLTDAQWFDEGASLMGRMQDGVGHFLFPDLGSWKRSKFRYSAGRGGSRSLADGLRSVQCALCQRRSSAP